MQGKRWWSRPFVAILGLAMLGCSSTLELKNITCDKRDDHSITLRLESISNFHREFPQHLFFLKYAVLDSNAARSLVPSPTSDATELQRKEFDEIGASLSRDDESGLLRCDLVDSSGILVSQQLNSGRGRFRMVEGSTGPPYQYEIVLPISYPKDRQVLVMDPRKPYSLFFRLTGIVPTFGIPFQSHREIDSNVLGVVVPQN